MKALWRHCAFAIACLLAAPFTLASDEQTVERELEVLSEELNALDQWVTETERERNLRQRELRRLDTRVEGLERDLSESNALFLTQSEGILDLTDEQAELRRRLSREGESLLKLAGVLSRLSGRRYAMLIFEQTSALQIDRVMRYTEVLRDTYFDRLEDFARSAADLHEIRTRLEQGIERARSLQQELTGQRQALLAEREARSELLASIKNELVSRGQEREALIEARTRIRTLLEELRARVDFKSGADFGKQRGGLPWPVQGRLRHAFGAPRSGTNVTWQGIFIATESQSEIRAVHGGTTVYRNWLKGFGNLMVIAHGEQHMSVYAQADSFFKSINDPVEGGEVIGLTGTSGGAREQGVYFEIRVGGAPENPQVWLGRPSSTP